MELPAPYVLVVLRYGACLSTAIPYLYLYYFSMFNRDPTGQWEYEMPFDLNMKDVTGQNVLYVASFLGNYKMVELLLKFRLKASRIKASINQ
jgi:ankyrin repeat protein